MSELPHEPSKLMIEHEASYVGEPYMAKPGLLTT
jgi:hypothetical protein